MKVFLAGATGVLGRRLVGLLSQHGHVVVAPARSAEKARWLVEHGASACDVSLFDSGSLARAAEGCEVVVHAATSIPRAARVRPRDWAENDRLRRQGTQALAACAAKIGARAYVQQSVVWVARPPDGGSFDESSPPNSHPLMQSAYDGEQIAADAGRSHAFSVAVLRCGWFYGADAAHTQMIGDGLRRRRIPLIGRGDAVWACLHLDDAATAFRAAIETPQSGLWHVVDDQPVTVREFLSTFASLLGARPPRSVPAWLARLVGGEHAVEFLTQSTRTSNARFQRDFHWSPRHADYRDGLRQVVAQWNRGAG